MQRPHVCEAGQWEETKTLSGERQMGPFANALVISQTGGVHTKPGVKHQTWGQTPNCQWAASTGASKE